MSDLMKLIEKPNYNDFDSIKISIASPEDMVSWSTIPIFWLLVRP